MRIGIQSKILTLTTSNYTVLDCYCCRMNFYQYFIVLGSGFFHFFELKNFRRSVFCAYNRFHFCTLPFYLIVFIFISDHQLEAGF